MTISAIIDNAPANPLKPFEAGELPSASHFNEVVTAVQGITTGLRPPRQVLPEPLSQPAAISGRISTKRFRPTVIHREYLICKAVLPDGTVGGSVVYVARPYKLRAPATNGALGSIVYSSYSPSGFSRTASFGSSQELQHIIPTYRTSDDIIAINGIDGGTGVSYTDTDGVSIAITWLDLNVDARVWARIN